MIVVIVGLGISDVVIVVVNFVGLFYVFVVSYVFMSRLFSNRICFKYFFCIVFFDIFMVRVVIDFLCVLKWNFVYVLYFDIDYGRLVIEIFEYVFLVLVGMNICLVVKRIFIL